MAILNRLYPAVLAVLLTACYEDFTPDIDSTPVLCINALITAGEPVEPEVSRSWFYTDVASATDHRVPDARVTVYANGTPVPPGYVAAEADRIRIVAESPTYGRAEAEVTVPVAVPAASLKWVAVPVDIWDSEIPGMENVLTLKFDVAAELTLADAAATPDYYHFDYSAFGEETEDGLVQFSPGTFHYEAEPIFSEHIGLLDAVTGSDAQGFTLFSDRQFAGKSYTLRLQFGGMMCETSGQAPDCGLEFALSTVSESFYNLCCYRWMIDEGLAGNLEDVGLGEPLWGYSNVSTGAGVVAAQSRTTYRIDLKEFIKEQLQ